MGFLLSLIPGPWLAVLKGLPWRLIGYGVAVLALLLFAWRIHAWHQGYLALEATEKALAASEAKVSQYARDAVAQQEAFTRAATRAKSIEAADKAAAQEIQRALQVKLAAADADSRNLGRLLRDAQARRCGSPLSGPAGAVGGTPGTSGESSSEGGTDAAIDAAQDRYHAACAKDAARLDALNALMDRAEANR